MTGKAKITKGYDLKAKYIIHTVGPIWRGGRKNEAKLLASCYVSSLILAHQYHLKTIAFPAISCGIYGYPLSQAATIAVKEVANFLEHHNNIETAYFVCFDETTFQAFEHALNAMLCD